MFIDVTELGHGEKEMVETECRTGNVNVEK